MSWAASRSRTGRGPSGCAGSPLTDLKALQKARGHAVNDLLDDHGMGVAHHQVDVFLLEPGTDRYLGRLCHFGVCPKHKPECRVEGCGASLFLRQHERFVFDPRSLQRGTVLFDRARGIGPPAPDTEDGPPPAADDGTARTMDEDDVPFDGDDSPSDEDDVPF